MLMSGRCLAACGGQMAADPAWIAGHYRRRAFVLTMVLTPKYQAETRILIETRRIRLHAPADRHDDEARPLLDEEGHRQPGRSDRLDRPAE